MALDSDMQALLSKDSLFIGVSAEQAQKHYDALNKFYGTDKNSVSLLDLYMRTLTRFVTNPEFDWGSRTGNALDKSRDALCERIARKCHARHSPGVKNHMNFVTNYVMDYGHRDLYRNPEKDRGHGILYLGDSYGLTPEHNNTLYLSTALMLKTEGQAQMANHLMTRVHFNIMDNATGLSQNAIDGVALISRPLIELSVLAFRNRGFEIMAGAKKSGIKAYEPKLYNFNVAKLPIIETTYFDFQTLKNEIRELPKYPSPRPRPGG
jgi:hypothetical protein